MSYSSRVGHKDAVATNCVCISASGDEKHIASKVVRKHYTRVVFADISFTSIIIMYIALQ